MRTTMNKRYKYLIIILVLSFTTLKRIEPGITNLHTLHCFTVSYNQQSGATEISCSKTIVNEYKLCGWSASTG